MKTSRRNVIASVMAATVGLAIPKSANEKPELARWSCDTMSHNGRHWFEYAIFDFRPQTPKPSEPHTKLIPGFSPKTPARFCDTIAFSGWRISTSDSGSTFSITIAKNPIRNRESVLLTIPKPITFDCLAEALTKNGVKHEAKRGVVSWWDSFGCYCHKPEFMPQEPQWYSNYSPEHTNLESAMDFANQRLTEFGVQYDNPETMKTSILRITSIEDRLKHAYEVNEKLRQMLPEHLRYTIF